MSNSETKKRIPNAVKFAIGGSAGMAATLVVQPLDLIKNRMQLSGEGGKPRATTSTAATIMNVVKQEGVVAMYTGLSAGLFRQATYTTTRMGVYTTIMEKYTVDGKPPGVLDKLWIGLTAGAIGSIVGTPAEIALIRMTADGRLPMNERRNYKNVFDALKRICTEEGVLTMWRGCGPTVARAMVVNMAQLASYSQAKEFVLRYMGDHIGAHFVSSMISGLVTTIFSMPVDIIKTRIQNMKYIDGKPEYSSVMDCVKKTMGKEGFFSLWKGFTPYYFRLGPHTVLTFIAMEQLNKLYKRHILNDMSSGGGL